MLRSHIQMEKKIEEKIAYGSLFIGMNEESLRLYESIGFMKKAENGTWTGNLYQVIHLLFRYRYS